jgi:hypothetical protein
VEEFGTGGQQKQEGSQVEAAETAQQAFATARGAVAGEWHETTLISHLPPLYHAMIAAMERQLERTTPPLRSLLLCQQPTKLDKH